MYVIEPYSRSIYCSRTIYTNLFTKSPADGCFNFWGDCLRDLFLWNTIKVKRNCHTCEEYQMFYYDLFVHEAQ